jgi:NAD(P)H-hydrate epimerase
MNSDLSSNLPLVLTREQTREVDRIALEEFGIPGIVLMENAGRGCVDELMRLGCRGPVTICCGRGNNGGDGFVIARHLSIRDIGCKVLLFCEPSEIAGDALINFEIVSKTPIEIVTIDSSWTDADMRTAMAEVAGRPAEWLIDAWLGTGATGAPRAPLDRAIRIANSLRAKRMAIDVPTGFDCDTGAVAGVAFHADVTCTFVALKTGYFRPESRLYAGDVRVVHIGIPPPLIRCVAGRSSEKSQSID